MQQDSGLSSGRRLEYKYDAVGNRMYSTENFGGSSVGDLRTSYFAYDTMNRQILVDGTIDNNAYTNANLSETRGLRISYDFDGNRTREISGSGGWRQNEYYYDALGRLITTDELAYNWNNGNPVNDLIKRITRSYDKADRLVAIDLGHSEVQVSRYNTKGQLDAQAMILRDGFGYGYGAESLISNTYDAVGNLTQAQSRGTGYINTSTYTYRRLGDSYKQDLIETTQVMRQPGNFAWAAGGNGQIPITGNTWFTYDFDGALSYVNKFRAGSAMFDNDTNGIARSKRSWDDAGNQLPRTFNLTANGQVLGTWGNGERDFIAFQAIDTDFASGGQQTYQVRAGDTLRTIAAAVFGDAQLWYLIAEANALGDGDLRVGQTLLLPNRTATVHNNAATFEPYNAAKFVGDTMPYMPGPTAWQPSECAQVGIMVAAIAASILIGIAATAATVATLGLATVAVSPAAAILISAVIGAAAGATASMVSQGIMVAGKLQKEMNWAEVGISAGVGFATGLFSGGMSVLSSRAAAVALTAKSAGEAVKKTKTLLFFGSTFKSAISASKAGKAAMSTRQLKYLGARMLLEGALDAGVDAGAQGVRMAVGIQKKFEWGQTLSAFGSGAISGMAAKQNLDAYLTYRRPDIVPALTKTEAQVRSLVLSGTQMLNNRSTALALGARTALGGVVGASAGIGYDAALQGRDIASGKQSEWDWRRMGVSAAIGGSAGVLSGVAGKFMRASLELSALRTTIVGTAKIAHAAINYGVGSAEYRDALLGFGGELLGSGGFSTKRKTIGQLHEQREVQSQRIRNNNVLERGKELAEIRKLAAVTGSVQHITEVNKRAREALGMAAQRKRDNFSDGVSISRGSDLSLKDSLWTTGSKPLGSNGFDRGTAVRENELGFAVRSGLREYS